MINAMVSIIIPVYNAEMYLKDTLKSIMNQTYKNLEIIIINDGSTDNSQNILEKFASVDNRIKIINQQNMGQAISRNKGIKKSKGEFILFVDSDDFIDVETVQICLEKIEDNNIVVFGVNQIIDNKKIVDIKYQTKVYNANKAYEILISNKLFNYSPCNKLCRSDFIKSNNILFPNCRGMEDFLFVLKLFFYSKKIKTIDNVFYNYVQHIGSISKNFNNDKIINTIKVIREIDLFVQQTKQNKYRKYFINLYYSLIFDTLSLIIRYSEKDNKKNNFYKFFNEIKKLQIYSFQSLILFNKLNMLRFVKFKIYDLFLKRF